MKESGGYLAPLCGAALSLALLSAPVFAESQPPAETTPVACVGDCSRDGTVTVDELLTMVNIALGNALDSACPAGDADNSGDISVNEIVAAVNNALNSCEPTVPTPSPTLTPTASPTVTPDPGISTFQGTLAPTTGRFNYNATLGLPGSDAACNTKFPGSHTCTYAELQTADVANELVGLPNTSFWAIDSAQPFNRQCNTNIPWDYQTAHTGRFGDVVPLTDGHLGSLVPSSVCANSHAVACCQ